VRDALAKLMETGFVVLTVPDKPRSKKQKMRITDNGKAWLASQPE
jgi:DNA-binding PadR family transcriptional regulator